MTGEIKGLLQGIKDTASGLLEKVSTKVTGIWRTLGGKVNIIAVQRNPSQHKLDSIVSRGTEILRYNDQIDPELTKRLVIGEEIVRNAPLDLSVYRLPQDEKKQPELGPLPFLEKSKVVYAVQIGHEKFKIWEQGLLSQEIMDGITECLGVYKEVCAGFGGSNGIEQARGDLMAYERLARYLGIADGRILGDLKARGIGEETEDTKKFFEKEKRGLKELYGEHYKEPAAKQILHDIDVSREDEEFWERFDWERFKNYDEEFWKRFERYAALVGEIAMKKSISSHSRVTEEETKKANEIFEELQKTFVASRKGATFANIEPALNGLKQAIVREGRAIGYATFISEMMPYGFFLRSRPDLCSLMNEKNQEIEKCFRRLKQVDTGVLEKMGVPKDLIERYCDESCKTGSAQMIMQGMHEATLEDLKNVVRLFRTVAWRLEAKLKQYLGNENNPFNGLLRRITKREMLEKGLGGFEERGLEWQREHPNLSFGYLALGETYAQEGRDEEAMNGFCKAFELMGFNSGLLDQLKAYLETEFKGVAGSEELAGKCEEKLKLHAENDFIRDSFNNARGYVTEARREMKRAYFEKDSEECFEAALNSLETARTKLAENRNYWARQLRTAVQKSRGKKKKDVNEGIKTLKRIWVSTTDRVKGETTDENGLEQDVMNETGLRYISEHNPKLARIEQDFMSAMYEEEVKECPEFDEQTKGLLLSKLKEFNDWKKRPDLENEVTQCLEAIVENQLWDMIKFHLEEQYPEVHYAPEKYYKPEEENGIAIIDYDLIDERLKQAEHYVMAPRDFKSISGQLSKFERAIPNPNTPRKKGQASFETAKAFANYFLGRAYFEKGDLQSLKKAARHFNAAKDVPMKDELTSVFAYMAHESLKAMGEETGEIKVAKPKKKAAK